MVRLTRLRIDRFRNVKEGTDLRFGPTFNVLLGKNATGKSTLLDLIAAVTNDDSSSYSNEDTGYDLTWWIEEGDLQIEQRMVRSPATSAILPDHLGEQREFDDVLTVLLRKAGRQTDRLMIIGARGTWTHDDEPEVAFDLRASVGAGGNAIQALATVLGKHPERPLLTSGVLEALSVLLSPGIGRFDEALSSLHDITDAPFVLKREGPAPGATRFGHWHPMAFITAAKNAASADSLAIAFSDLGTLDEVPSILGFTSAEIRPRLHQRTQDGEKVTTIYQGFDCLFQREDGSQISHELLSFGQKRLFAFLWYLAVRDRLPVVADEFLNGLHHEWIEVCFERLRDRQSFLATQHPLLLDHIPIQSAEGARTTFVRCSIEKGSDGRERLAWRNLDEAEAERFFVAYETGIQQVSEVLRSEGLW